MPLCLQIIFCVFVFANYLIGIVRKELSPETRFSEASGFVRSRWQRPTWKKGRVVLLNIFKSESRKRCRPPTLAVT